MSAAKLGFDEKVTESQPMDEKPNVKSEQRSADDSEALNMYICKNKFLVRQLAELDSTPLGFVDVGQEVDVLETCVMPTGQHRLRFRVGDGDQFAWCSLHATNGIELLQALQPTGVAATRVERSRSKTWTSLKLGESPECGELELVLATQSYVCVSKCLVRQTEALDSTPLGFIEDGEEIIVLEKRVLQTGQERLRFKVADSDADEFGWCSLATYSEGPSKKIFFTPIDGAIRHWPVQTLSLLAARTLDATVPGHSIAAVRALGLR